MVLLLRMIERDLLHQQLLLVVEQLLTGYNTVSLTVMVVD
jgi:hypothetical protein